MEPEEEGNVKNEAQSKETAEAGSSEQPVNTASETADKPTAGE